jgi:hypothetical protein
MGSGNSVAGGFGPVPRTWVLAGEGGFMVGGWNSARRSSVFLHRTQGMSPVGRQRPELPEDTHPPRVNVTCTDGENRGRRGRRTCSMFSGHRSPDLQLIWDTTALTQRCPTPASVFFITVCGKQIPGTHPNDGFRI